MKKGSIEMNNLQHQVPQCLGIDRQITKVPRCKLLNRTLLKNTERFDIFMKPWLEKAQAESKQGNPFGAMIYLWVTFNAWLTRIVSEIIPEQVRRRDRPLVQAAGLDPQLSRRFNDLLREDCKFHSLATEFRSLWPVFEVRALVDKKIGLWGAHESRSAYRVRCFTELKPRHYEPRCYRDHQPSDQSSLGGDPSEVPLDWPHMLIAIYKVRCNLFHGGKSFLYSKHKHITSLAFEILWRVWGSEQLIDSVVLFASPSLLNVPEMSKETKRRVREAVRKILAEEGLI